MLGWLQCQLPNSFDYLYLCSLILFFHMKVLLYCSHFVSFHLSFVKHVAMVPDISCNEEFLFHRSPKFMLYLYMVATHYCNNKKIKTPEHAWTPFSLFGFQRLRIHAAHKVCYAFNHEEHNALKWKYTRKTMDHG